MEKLHHKSKRYEIQVYTETSLTWQPVAHTDLPDYALRRVASLNKDGKEARVRDRKCGGVVVTAKPQCLKK